MARNVRETAVGYDILYGIGLLPQGTILSNESGQRHENG
jgi:hypothetical protein